MSKTLKRIKQYYESKEMTSRQFSLSIGRSGAYFSNSLKKGSEPTSDMLSTIGDIYPDLNLDWAITGKGEMIKPTGLQEPKATYSNKLIDDLIDEKIEKRIQQLTQSKAFSLTVKELIALEIESELDDIQNKKTQKS